MSLWRGVRLVFIALILGIIAAGALVAFGVSDSTLPKMPLLLDWVLDVAAFIILSSILFLVICWIDAGINSVGVKLKLIKPALQRSMEFSKTLLIIFYCIAWILSLLVIWLSNNESILQTAAKLTVGVFIVSACKIWLKRNNWDQPEVLNDIKNLVNESSENPKQ